MQEPQSVEGRCLLSPGYGSELDRPVYDSSIKPLASPAYIPAASSPQCLEAKQLLELTARECCDRLPEAPLTAPSAGHVHTPAGSLGMPDKASTQHVDTPSAPHGHWSLVEPVPPRAQQQRAPCMTSSGSFSDALALLLRSRSSRNGAPASPTEGAQRSGLSVSTLAAALAPSNEPSLEGAGDDSGCQGIGSAPQTAAQPMLLQGVSVCEARRLPEVLEDPIPSVNAGVAWQFGDRIIPADLLRECEPSSQNASVVALASLL